MHTATYRDRRNLPTATERTDPFHDRQTSPRPNSTSMYQHN